MPSDWVVNFVIFILALLAVLGSILWFIIKFIEE